MGNMRFAEICQHLLAQEDIFRSPCPRRRMMMSKKLRFVVLVTLIFGSASTALAASNGTETHRSHPVRPGLLVTGAPAPAYSPGPPYSRGTWGGVEFYSKPGSSSLDPCGDMCGAIN